MSASQGKRRFARIDRLPPYVFNITAELKLAARRRGEDIIDMSMGNPDGATPPHIVAKLNEAALRPDTHGYSASRGIPRLRRAISHWYRDRYDVAIDPDSEAIVTIGGVALDEVNPATMESRIVHGLYFAGEVLDIDGPTGGYNLTLAFATARRAVASIAGRI